MLIPAGIGAIILGLISFYLIHPILGLPVMIIALFAFRRLLFNQVSGDVTVAHLLTGRTIHCKSLDELYAKENEITQKIKDHCEYLEGMDSLGRACRRILLEVIQASIPACCLCPFLYVSSVPSLLPIPYRVSFTKSRMNLFRLNERIDRGPAISSVCQRRSLGLLNW